MRRAVSIAATVAAATLFGSVRLRRAPSDAEQALRSGRYEQARRLACGARGRGPIDTPVLLQCVKAELALGRTADARKRLEVAADARPDDLPIRDALMRLYAAAGDRAALAPLVDASYSDWNGGNVARNRAGRPASPSPPPFGWTATGRTPTTSCATRSAPTRAPPPPTSTGATYCSRSTTPTTPRPRSRTCSRWTRKTPTRTSVSPAPPSSDRYDGATALEHLKRALAINPAHAVGLALRASLALDAENWPAAAADVAAIRRTNPHDAGAARIAAAAALLVDDRAGYERERAAQPGSAAARRRLLCVRRRDLDAPPSLRRRARYRARRGRGRSRGRRLPRRAGDDPAPPGRRGGGARHATPGLEAGPLRRPHLQPAQPVREDDPGALHDDRERPPALPHPAPTRAPPSRRSSRPIWRNATAIYVARYRFEPPAPVMFELYGDSHEFAVRTIGLPAIGVAGVCFGRSSPRRRPPTTRSTGGWCWRTSWRTCSRSSCHGRVCRAGSPRGCRSWRPARPGRSGRATTTSRCIARSAAVSCRRCCRCRTRSSPRGATKTARARTRTRPLAVDFLERRFGFAALREALAAFGRGEPEAAVLAKMTGLSAEALEQRVPRRAGAAVRALRQAIPAAATGAGPAAAPSPAKTATSPRMGGARSRCAARRRSRRGEPGARKARALPQPSPDDQADTLFLAGELALARRDADAAVAAFQGLLDLGAPAHDGYDVRVRLGLAEIHRKRPAEAEAHLRRAIELDPGRVEPLALLAELYKEQQRAADRLTALAAALRLDPQSRRVAKEVVLGEASGREVGAGRRARADRDLHRPGHAGPARGARPRPDRHGQDRRRRGRAGARPALRPAVSPALLHLELATLYDQLGDRNGPPPTALPPPAPDHRRHRPLILAAVLAHRQRQRERRAAPGGLATLRSDRRGRRRSAAPAPAPARSPSPSSRRTGRRSCRCSARRCPAPES